MNNYGVKLNFFIDTALIGEDGPESHPRTVPECEDQIAGRNRVNDRGHDGEGEAEAGKGRHGRPDRLHQTVGGNLDAHADRGVRDV